MGRKIEYFCDECKKVFGNETHLNIKGGDIRISHIRGGDDNWRQERFPIKCTEYHFCDVACLTKFLTKKYEETKVASKTFGRVITD